MVCTDGFAMDVSFRIIVVLRCLQVQDEIRVVIYRIVVMVKVINWFQGKEVLIVE
jgi:hypothetical protein